MATRVIDEGLARIAQVVMDDISHAAVGTGTTTLDISPLFISIEYNYSFFDYLFLIDAR
ncbi:hypothetical protein LCGC14_2748460 [marine sediment metagenome]|uniref:Uncharacterized protein n=1 Tax=marine sediment metagenome TaxID=412755 RepID=A0A0F9BB84_9ZZZZ